MPLKSTYHIAVPTAFDQEEELQLEATQAHILSLQTTGIASFLVCGTTGEQHSLSLAEKLRLVDSLEQNTQLKEDTEIIFGVASVRQKEAVALARKIAQATKISAILLGFPPYILPTQNEALAYVNAIAAVCPKPIILYNNPRRTGFQLSSETLLTLAKNEQIIGLKEAGDPTRILELKAQLPADFIFYAGGEVALSEKIALGFNRLSSIGGNLYPVEIKNWFEKLLAGHPHPFPLEQELLAMYETNTLAYIKKQLSLTGKTQMGPTRGPIGNSDLSARTPLSERKKA